MRVALLTMIVFATVTCPAGEPTPLKQLRIRGSALAIEFLGDGELLAVARTWGPFHPPQRVRGYVSLYLTESGRHAGDRILEGRVAHAAGSGDRLTTISPSGQLTHLHLERSQSSAARLPRPDYTLRPERLKRPEDSESTERDFGARGIARLARASNAQVLSSTVAHAIGTPSQFTVYDADGGVQFHIEQDDLLTSVALSPDGSVAIVAAGDPSHPVVWDAVRGVRLVDCRTPAPLPQSSSGHIGHVAFSANHSEFAFACDDFVAVWSVGEEQPHLVLGDDDGRVPKASGATEAPVVQAIEFHPSEDLLAAGFDDGSVRVWDLNSRRQVVALNALGRLQALAFSPDGKFLATLQSVPLRAVRSVERSNTMTLPTHANRRDEVWLWDFESLVATIDR